MATEENPNKSRGSVIYEYWHCSNCGERIIRDIEWCEFKYCPSCGEKYEVKEIAGNENFDSKSD